MLVRAVHSYNQNGANAIHLFELPNPLCLQLIMFCNRHSLYDSSPGPIMRKTSSPISNQTVARFRLKRHHFLDSAPTNAVTICCDICGAQAQVMSSAYLQLWARNHALTRADIEDALWKTRTLIKTSLMRQTLHIIPTDEFQMYIAAVKPCRLAGALRIMAKFGIEREEADSLTALIMKALSEGPLRRAAIHAAIRPKVSKRVHAWMERVWSILRLPVAEGMICYGSGENKEVAFIRTDHWLPDLKLKSIPAVEAQCALFRKYLSAYGPATAADFAHWAGISMPDARQIPPLLEPELAEVSVENRKCFLPAKDVSVLNKAAPAKSCVRLLPSFDTYLLAHREKDHLLGAKHYKRVYRNQAWISPAVLIDGEIAGVWSHKLQSRKLVVEIEPFIKLSRAIRSEIELEAEHLANYFQSSLECRFV